MLNVIYHYLIYWNILYFKLRRFTDLFVEVKTKCSVFERNFGRNEAPSITGFRVSEFERKNKFTIRSSV